MSVLDDRLDEMLRIADQSGLTLDELVGAIGRADQTIFDTFSERPSRLPRYIQSKDKP